jgi:hypothetical protein
VAQAKTLQQSKRHARKLALIAAALAIAGCQRRAPGPWECQAHAVRMVEEVIGPLATPQAEQAFQSEISRCLTTPYDRELVRCVEERGANRRCYQEFERRLRVAPGSQVLPDGRRGLFVTRLRAWAAG